MNLIIRQAKIIDRNSAFHNKIADILISDGIIKKIAEKISEKGDHEIDGQYKGEERSHSVFIGFGEC